VGLDIIRPPVAPGVRSRLQRPCLASTCYLRGGGTAVGVRALAAAMPLAVTMQQASTSY
jgi:hypothetical protein